MTRHPTLAVTRTIGSKHRILLAAAALGHDVQGRVMAAVAQRMTDAQMKALADYAAGLR